MLDGRALASVRVARGLESVLGVGSEFVVFVLSVVRHVDINLARFATRERRWCLVSSARTSGRRSANRKALLDAAPYRGWKGLDYQKRFRTPWELTQEPSPGRANSLVHLPYPTAQCAQTFMIQKCVAHTCPSSLGHSSAMDLRPPSCGILAPSFRHAHTQQTGRVDHSLTPSIPTPRAVGVSPTHLGRLLPWPLPLHSLSPS